MTYFVKLAYTCGEVMEMKIYKEDVIDIVSLIAFVLYLFAIAYVANGTSNWLIIIYAIVYTCYAIIGLVQQTKKYIEDHYRKKYSKQ